MADLVSPAGVAIGTALTSIWTNNTGVPGVATLTLTNVDGAADVFINACNWIDASASNAKTAILPTIFKVAKGDAVQVQKFMDPNDVLEASASATGDLVATVDFLKEPA